VSISQTLDAGAFIFDDLFTTSSFAIREIYTYRGGERQ
jgi:hypothetical protein